MANERLRAAVFAAGLGPEEVAERLGVDRKSVDRWIEGKIPYRRNQHAIARLLQVDPGYLWPSSSPEAARSLALAEVVGIWPIRSLVGNQRWIDLFAAASRQIDILVYAGFWLSEDPAVRSTLLARARAGVRLRLVFGDPRAEAVRLRGREEGIGDAIAAKIANTIHNYAEVLETAGVEARMHSTTLYCSIYRGDEEMLVNTHLYGQAGHMTPLLHLRRVPGAELFASYQASFERVWELARPLDLGAIAA